MKKKNYLKLQDALLNGATYLCSAFALFILVTLFVFIFQKGGALLNLDLLNNAYWSKNYQAVLVEQNPGIFKQPEDLSEGAVFSKRWGIAFVDHVDSYKEQMILVDYIDAASPFARLQDISIKTDPKELQLQVGMRVEKVQYQDEQGKVSLAGSMVKQNAKELAATIDEQAIQIDQLYLKTTGGGIRGSILTTAYLLVLSLLFAMPIGIGSAIYLQEYAQKQRFTGILQSAIDTLSGVPSIIFGLMGVSVLFPITQCFGATTTSILLGAMTMAIILLPTIITTTSEALLVVPQHLRDGSLSLGASQSQTIFKVVLPCAMPGILSGVLLSVGRIIGESAALIYTMGTFISDDPTLLTQGTSLAVHIWSVMSGEQPNFALASAISILILFFVLLLNLTIKFISKHFFQVRY